MNKILILSTLVLTITLIIYWISKKNKFSKCNKKCRIICPASKDDYKKIKDINLSECRTCENYCENNKSNDCCSQCSRGLIPNTKSVNEHNCSATHSHHYHKHNCHSEFRNSNIQLNWIWCLTLLLLAGAIFFWPMKNQPNF